jgi:arsenite methyltransferase
MDTKEEIKKLVRQTYGNVATRGGYRKDSLMVSSGCGSSQPEPGEKKTPCGCGGKDIDADRMSEFLGYSKEDLDSAPEGSNLGLGCGSPKTIASIKKGETIIDLGSGGGFDSFLVARETGNKGLVIGVDMTPEMVTRARGNKAKAKVENVEFRLGEIEHLPVGDNLADLIISNCVINLSPEKHQVYKDAFRVLKPGGRLAISDIVALKELPDTIKQDLSMVSACIGGAATIEDTKLLLKEAGFNDINITPKKVSQELIDEWLPGSRVGEYVVSAYIEAKKPLQHDQFK